MSDDGISAVKQQTPSTAHGINWVLSMLREYEWWIMFLVGAGAFSLGIWGFLEAGWPDRLGPSREMSLSDAFYRTLQLLVLEGGHANGGAVPFQLQIARLALPAIGGYVGIKLVLTLFGDEAGLLGLRLLRPSVVVCGLGDGGCRIVQALRRRGQRVVVIEKDPNNERAAASRRLGAVVLIDDATDPSVLERSRAGSADYVVSVCEGDRTNAEVSMQVRDIAKRKTSGSLTCVVRINDPQLCTLLKSYELGERHEVRFRLDCFNVQDSAARALLREFPSFSEREEGDDNPHLLVVGFGRFGQSLVVQASRRWVGIRHHAQSQLRVTVIDREASSRVASLLGRFPQLSSACDLAARDLDIESAKIDRSALLTADGMSDFTRVYVCLGDDSTAMTAALKIHHALREDAVPVVVRMRKTSGLASLLEQQDRRTDGEQLIQGFGVLEQAYDPDLLLGGTYEILARATHEEHVQSQRQEGYTMETNPSLVGWDELPETLKESNRDQAGHIGVKLAEVGCGIIPWADWDAASFEFSRNEVEMLARMEHDRWNAERLRNGWTFAPGEKDVDKKTSPYIVSWEELTDEIKELDRVPVRGMPGFLARAEFQIVRLRERPASEPVG